MLKKQFNLNRQTLNEESDNKKPKRSLWFLIRLALFVLRLLLKIIEFFSIKS